MQWSLELQITVMPVANSSNYTIALFLTNNTKLDALTRLIF